MSISSFELCYTGVEDVPPPRLRGDDSDRDVCLAEPLQGRRRSRDARQFLRCAVRLLEAVDQRLELRRVRAQSRPRFSEPGSVKTPRAPRPRWQGSGRPSTASVDFVPKLEERSPRVDQGAVQSNRTAVIVPTAVAVNPKGPRSDRTDATSRLTNGTSTCPPHAPRAGSPTIVHVHERERTAVGRLSADLADDAAMRNRECTASGPVSADDAVRLPCENATTEATRATPHLG